MRPCAVAQADRGRLQKIEFISTRTAHNTIPPWAVANHPHVPQGVRVQDLATPVTDVDTADTLASNKTLGNRHRMIHSGLADETLIDESVLQSVVHTPGVLLPSRAEREHGGALAQNPQLIRLSNQGVPEYRVSQCSIEGPLAQWPRDQSTPGSYEQPTLGFPRTVSARRSPRFWRFARGQVAMDGRDGVRLSSNLICGTPNYLGT